MGEPTDPVAALVERLDTWVSELPGYLVDRLHAQGRVGRLLDIRNDLETELARITAERDEEHVGACLLRDDLRHLRAELARVTVRPERE